MDSRRKQSEGLRLDPEGNWYQGEYPILHDRTIQFLFKNIHQAEDGSYFLTGEDKPISVDVEDVPYWIAKIERTIAGYLVTLTDDSIELLNPHALWRGKGEALYCLVKGGKCPAKFQRNAYYEIVKDLKQDGKLYQLVLGRLVYPVETTTPKMEMPVKKAPKQSGKAAAKRSARKKPSSPKKVLSRKNPSKKSKPKRVLKKAAKVKKIKKKK